MDVIYSCMPRLVGLFHLKWYFIFENGVFNEELLYVKGVLSIAN